MRDTVILAVCIVLVIVLVIAVIKANKSENSGYSSDDELFNEVLKSLDYECNLVFEGWPDAIFEIEFSEIPEDGIKERIHNSLVDFIMKYNEECEKTNSEGVIHYISELGDFEEAPDEMSIHIDFGSCNPLVLKDILTLLNKSEYKINRVDVL